MYGLGLSPLPLRRSKSAGTLPQRRPGAAQYQFKAVIGQITVQELNFIQWIVRHPGRYCLIRDVVIPDSKETHDASSNRKPYRTQDLLGRGMGRIFCRSRERSRISL